MIQTVLGVFLILLHIVCCVLVWLGIKTHLLKVKKYLMALVIFVPFWGTVCVLLLHLQMLTRRDNRIEPGVEKLRVNEEIYKYFSGSFGYGQKDRSVRGSTFD